MEPRLENTQCHFRPGRSTTDKLFTQQQIFDKSRLYVNDVVRFVDFDQTCNQVPRKKLREVLLE